MDRLLDTEIAALHEALDDEYLAWSTYGQVIEDFGPIRPFINIRDAEARHIQALKSLYDAYGIPVPVNPWPGRVDRYGSVQQACAAAVAAEVANGELYERLLAAVATRPDIVGVFRNLQQASQQRHLPAFRRCTERGAGAGRGPGVGPRAHRHRRACGS